MPDDTPDEKFIAWFELKPEYGIDHEDNPEPIVESALSLAIPVMLPSGRIVTGSQVCKIAPADELTDTLLVRVIPGTRIVETSSMLAAQALYSLPTYQQLIDEPTREHIKSARDATAAHHDAMARRAAMVAKGEEHPADVNDPNPVPVPAAGNTTASIPASVGFALSKEDRAVIDDGVLSGEILDNDAFVAWLADTSIPAVVEAVEGDRVLATRALVAEQDRGDDARKGLVEQLTKTLTEMEA